MTETLYHGFRRIDFTFEDREAILVFPNEPREDGKWLLKTEYFSAFQDFELEMVGRGFHLAYLKNITRGHDERDDDARARFCEFLREEYHLAPTCMPVGMSCGGMLAVYFATKYPQYVGALYLDAPVINLCSCPAGMGVGKDELFGDFFKHRHMTKSELIGYRDHPLDRLPTLLKTGIPVMMVAGDCDDTVPYEENGKQLVDAYRAAGADVTEIIKPGCGHHPHGLEDLTPLIDFTYQKYAK